MEIAISGFDIRISRKNSSDLFDGDDHTLHVINSNKNLFKLHPVLIDADPFLFVKEEMLYLFYEEQVGYKNGVIRMVKTRDLVRWSSPVTVLREPFHLSFPVVFQENGVVYMLPETEQDSSVRLYRANDDLTSWSLVETLLEGERYVDSSVYKDGDVFYLFTTAIVKGSYQQKLFVSDSLYGGKYVEHPNSPISVDARYSRNAGSVFSYNGQLFRPTQDCSTTYGENVSILQIQSLSKTEYQETVYKDNLLDVASPFYREGGHQFNFVQLDGAFIVATDAKRNNYNVWLQGERVYRKCRSLIKL